MKFSKKLFKRFLCTTLSAVMLTGTMSFGTVFASTGKISDKSYSELVTYQSDKGSGLLKTYANGSTINSEEGYTYMPTSTKVKDGVTTYGDTNQLATNGFDLDKTGDIMGTFIFKIKTSDNKRNNDVLLINASDANDYSGQQFTCFIMDQEQRMGSGKTPSWKYILDQDESMQGQAEQYYTIGLVFKKDYTYDVYVDGVKAVTATITNENVKAAMDNTQKLYFYFTVMDNSISSIKSDEDIAKYYLKDFVWQKGGGELIAEADKASYSAGDTAKIKFSAPLASIDTSKIKVFESATGTELNTTGVTYENDEVKVPVPTNVKSGAEYRIELPEVTDVVGNKLTNDNVYFNAAQGGDTYEIIDTYETFDSMDTGTYTAPNGWAMYNRSDPHRGYSQLKTENGNPTLNIGTEVQTDGSNWPMVGIYHNLSKTYTDGIVSISYDIQPGNYIQTSRTGDNYIALNLNLFGYKEKLNNGNDLVSNAKLLAGVIGNQIGAPKVNFETGVLNTHINKDDQSKVWYNAHTVTNSEVGTKWFNVRVDLDLDNELYKYYLDGEEVYSSNTLLNDMGLNDQISAIALYIGAYGKKSDQLIDNVKVSHITNKSLDTEKATTAFSDDFSGYVKHGYSAEEQYHNNLGGNNQNAWVPKGWGHEGSWGYNSGAAEMLPTAVEGHGTVMDMAVLGSAEWHAPNLYHTLDKQYTQGVLTVDYDVNVRRIVNTTDEDFAAITFTNKNTNAFNMVLYSEKFTNEQLNIGNVGYVGNNGSGADEAQKQYISTKYGKKIFGIDSGKFNVYKKGDGSKFVSQKDLTAETWYSVRHVIDITNNSIKTFVGTSKDDLQLLGVSNLSDFTADSFDGTKIGGIGFSINQKAYLAHTYLDNVSVTHSDFVSQKGVSAVRYSDIKDNMYGSATETSTLVNAVAVSFTDTPDDLDNKVTISDGNNTIGYTSSFDNDTNTYMMNLSELLTADKEYTLTIEGVTFGGEAMETYTHKIKAEEKGVFEISPISLTVNDAKVTGTQVLKKGDTVKASVNIINTTGEEKEVAFSTGIYKDKMLDKFDYRQFTLNGSSSNGKYAEDTITFTMGDDAADVSKVRAYLWDSMQNMLPYTDSVDINCK